MEFDTLKKNQHKAGKYAQVKTLCSCEKLSTALPFP